MQDINQQLSALQLPTLPNEGAHNDDRQWKWSDVGTLPTMHGQTARPLKSLLDLQVTPPSIPAGEPILSDYTNASAPAAASTAGNHHNKPARADDVRAPDETHRDQMQYCSCSPVNSAHAQSTRHRAVWRSPNSRSPSPPRVAPSDSQGQPWEESPSCMTLPGFCLSVGAFKAGERCPSHDKRNSSCSHQQHYHFWLYPHMVPE